MNNIQRKYLEGALIAFEQAGLTKEASNYYLNKLAQTLTRPLINRVSQDPFDLDLQEEILMDSSEPVALAALARADVPPEVLIDLKQNVSPNVRTAVMQHPNYPHTLLPQRGSSLAKQENKQGWLSNRLHSIFK